MGILDRIGKLFGKDKPTLKSLSVDDLKRMRLPFFFVTLLMAISAPSQEPLPLVLNLKTLATHPHDSRAYTQGLAFEDGFLYESAGQYTRSTLRKVDPKTGVMLMSVTLPKQYFAEGMDIVGDKIYQLTWREEICFVYDKKTFQLVDKFKYSGEGWGLAYDGQRLILGDGSATLRFYDPTTFKQKGKISVTYRDPKTKKSVPVTNLNELEYIHGEVWANVWQTPNIARINPKTGDVIAWIDFTNFVPEQFKQEHSGRGGDNVLNGIAFDKATDRLFITGKNWPILYEIQIVRENPSP